MGDDFEEEEEEAGEEEAPPVRSAVEVQAEAAARLPPEPAGSDGVRIGARLCCWLGQVALWLRLFACLLVR